MPIGVIWGEPQLRKREPGKVEPGWYWIDVDGRKEIAECRPFGSWLLVGAFREKHDGEVTVISARLECPISE